MRGTTYCRPADVLRKFDPTLDESILEQDGLFGAGDAEKIIARIEEVEGEFESRTRNPQRRVRVGVPGSPATYEAHSADLRRHQGGVKVWLDNRDVIPIDAEEGDVIEIRTGRDSWRDITANTDRWEMHARDGWVRFFSRLRNNFYRPAARDRVVRVCYRHGALGGKPHDAGETETAEALEEGASSVQVEDPARLPRRGVALVGGTEYASIEAGADGIDLTARGLRGTQETDHEAGATVHYCPLDVRSAVAARAAQEMVRYDDYADEMPTPDDSISHKDKIEDWEEEWQTTLSKYSEARML